MAYKPYHRFVAAVAGPRTPAIPHAASVLPP